MRVILIFWHDWHLIVMTVEYIHFFCTHTHTHISAGVGRTGTFIAIDVVLEQIAKEQVVDIAGVVNRMRLQRMKMVQTMVGRVSNTFCISIHR